MRPARFSSVAATGAYAAPDPGLGAQSATDPYALVGPYSNSHVSVGAPSGETLPVRFAVFAVSAEGPSVTTAGESCVNRAVTVVAAVSVSVHVPVPEQPPPDQPANTEPGAGFAVSVTSVFSSSSAEHVAPQSIPAGEEETMPLPFPGFVMLSA